MPVNLLEPPEELRPILARYELTYTLLLTWTRRSQTGKNRKTPRHEDLWSSLCLGSVCPSSAFIRSRYRSTSGK